ncbi:MAG: hypothetical protein ACREHG_03440, partial [Candidatus Saccharimonadales bacterium]
WQVPGPVNLAALRSILTGRKPDLSNRTGDVPRAAQRCSQSRAHGKPVCTPCVMRGKTRFDILPGTW